MAHEWNCKSRHTVVCSVDQEDWECVHNMSLLTWKVVYDFMPVCSFVISCPSNIKFTVQVFAYQGKLHTRFEIKNIATAISEIQPSKSCSFSFAHLQKKTAIKHKHIFGLPSNLAHIRRDIGQILLPNLF